MNSRRHAWVARIFWMATIGLALAVSPHDCLGGPAARPGGGLTAGAAIVDISPESFPVRVNAMFTERTGTRTVDPLQVRAVVLSSGPTRIAIAVVDSCMVPRDLIDAAKQRASTETGIPMDRMLVSSTHTHSAPAAMGCLGSRVDPRYAAWLPGRIAESIIEANRRLEPARVAWTSVDDWDHTYNRRWIRRPDKVFNDPFGNPTVRAHMHPGHESADVTGPSGPVDPGLSVLALQTSTGRPLAVLANYSQHYYDSPLLSSDYYGRFRVHLAEMLGADDRFVAIMSQGTSGDLMWMDYGARRHEIGYDAYAREVAQRVAGAMTRLRWRDEVPLRMAERKLTLGFRVPDAKRLAWAREMAAKLGDRLPQTQPEIYALEAIHLHERPQAELKLQAVRIGDLGIAAIPNEVFALTGLKIKAQSPLASTFNIELANGAEGYIPPPEQHRLGGYTTWPARTAGLEEQAEPRIVDAVLSLLEDVSGKPRRTMRPGTGPGVEALRKLKPAGYWRLDDPAGVDLVDSMGSGGALRVVGNAALYLPGVGSGDGFGATAALRPSAFAEKAINRAVHLAGGWLQADAKGVGDRFTVVCWFWNGLPTGARAVTGDLFNRDGLVVGIGGTNGAPGRLFVSVPGAGKPSLGNRDVGMRGWHQLAVTRDGSTVAVYLDGALEVMGGVATGGRGGVMNFGGGGGEEARFEGKLDEIAIFGRNLDAKEVEGAYREGLRGGRNGGSR